MPETENDPKSEVDSKPKKPAIKPRKKFVAKKNLFKSDKPQEYRVRHIRLASLDSAQLVHQTIVDLQKELAEKPMDDPDKEYIDQQRMEKFFIKLAKKYSACQTRTTGGDLEWLHKPSAELDAAEPEAYDKTNFLYELPQFNSVLTPDLVEAIMNTEKHIIPEPIKTKLGYHIIMVCETRDYSSKEEPKKDGRTLLDDIHKDATHAQPKQWDSDIAPN